MRTIKNMFEEEFIKFISKHEPKTPYSKPTCEFNSIYESVKDEGSDNILLEYEDTRTAFQKLASGARRAMNVTPVGAQFGMNMWGSSVTVDTAYSLHPRGNAIKVVGEFKRVLKQDYIELAKKISDARNGDEEMAEELKFVNKQVREDATDYYNFAALIINFRLRSKSGHPISVNDFVAIKTGEQISDYKKPPSEDKDNNFGYSKRTVRSSDTMTKGMDIDYADIHEFLKKHFKPIGLYCGTQDQFEASAKHTPAGRLAKGIKSAYDFVKIA